MRLGIMCSGNGTNFENIITNPICNKHEVVLMIHNTKKCGAIERAERLGVHHCRIKHKDVDNAINLFKVWKVDLIVLAGYMRILSPKMIEAFPNKIINIHPSLLPKYKGIDAIQQALDSGDKTTGCTVHYVNEELDSGKIIDQSTVMICPDDTIETLTQRVQQAEHRLLPLVINSYE